MFLVYSNMTTPLTVLPHPGPSYCESKSSQSSKTRTNITTPTSNVVDDHHRNFTEVEMAVGLFRCCWWNSRDVCNDYVEFMLEFLVVGASPRGSGPCGRTGRFELGCVPLSWAKRLNYAWDERGGRFVACSGDPRDNDWSMLRGVEVEELQGVQKQSTFISGGRRSGGL